MFSMNQAAMIALNVSRRLPDATDDIIACAIEFVNDMADDTAECEEDYEQWNNLEYASDSVARAAQERMDDYMAVPSEPSYTDLVA